jgi:hypothetical protein
MLLVCVSIYLKSVLRHEFLISNTYHPDIYSYVSTDVRIRGFFRSQRGYANKNLGTNAVDFGQNICLYSAQKIVNTTPIALLSVSNTLLSATFGVDYVVEESLQNGLTL